MSSGFKSAARLVKSIPRFDSAVFEFTNRAADLNPDDIATLTVLKGPEAAALYGIGGAHGAIVITTKHGGAGGGWVYNNSFRIETAHATPQLQRAYGPSS